MYTNKNQVMSSSETMANATLEIISNARTGKRTYIQTMFTSSHVKFGVLQIL